MHVEVDECAEDEYGRNLQLVEDRKAAAQKQGLKDNEDHIEDEGSRSERERKDLAKHIRKRADRRCADV